MNAAPRSRLARLWQALPRLSTTWMLVLSFTTSQTLTWIQPEQAEAANVDEAKATCDQFMDGIVASGQGSGNMNYGAMIQDVTDAENIPELSAKFIISKCGSPADLQSEGKAIPALTTTVKAGALTSSDQKFNQCKDELTAAWNGQLGKYCVVLQQSDIAKTAQTVAMVFYGIAAAVCLIALIVVIANTWNGSGQWGKGLAYACMGLGLIGMFADIASIIQLENAAGGEGRAQGQDALSFSLGTLGTLFAVVPQFGTTFVGATNANYADAAVSLTISTVLFTAVFFAKLDSMNKIEDSKKAAATEVARLGSDFQGTTINPGSFSIPSSTPQNPRLSGGGGGGSGGGGASSGGAGNGGGRGGGGSLDGIANDLNTQSGLERSFNASSSFAKSDPLAQKLNKDGKVSELAKNLKAQGADLATAMKAAAGGNGIGGFTKGLGGPFAQAASSPAGQQIISETERFAKEDFSKTKLASELVKSGLIPTVGGGSSAGKGSSNAAANPFAGMFGAKTPAADAAAIEKFGDKDNKKKSPLADLPESTDIWHGGDARSIFQIVSRRIDKTRDRTHTLDWESKLNRAIHGSLLSKPSAATASPTVSPRGGGGSK